MLRSCPIDVWLLRDTTLRQHFGKEVSERKHSTGEMGSNDLTTNNSPAKGGRGQRGVSLAPGSQGRLTSSREPGANSPAPGPEPGANSPAPGPEPGAKRQRSRTEPAPLPKFEGKNPNSRYLFSICCAKFEGKNPNSKYLSSICCATGILGRPKIPLLRDTRGCTLFSVHTLQRTT